MYEDDLVKNSITALVPGNNGESVRFLQETLKSEGFYTDVLDGNYGPNTEYAVRRYQTMHGLTVDGMAGPETLSSLGIYSGISVGVQTTGALQPGDSGDEVRFLQQILSNRGYYDNSIDGSYGPATENSVRTYQTDNGLTIDGMAGPGTLTSLGIYEGKSGAIGAMQPGDTGEEVKILQRHLANNGFYSGSIDGSYGPGTKSAVRNFQSANGLTIDGMAGPETLSSLGIYNGSFSSELINAVQRGDSGGDVRILQQALVDNNFYPDVNAANFGVDGYFGSKTEDAVRRYQLMKGLSVDGSAGPETLSSLGIYGSGSGSSRGSGFYGDALLPGDVGDAVRILQETLADLGYYSDSIDGSYGPATERAVRSYQSSNGLTVDGNSGPKTLSSLGLKGSNADDIDISDTITGGNFADVSIVEKIIPFYNSNRPGTKMNPTYITIHETANTNSAATAAMHAEYVKRHDTPTSWHYTVDSWPVIYQHLPLDEIGYHAGDTYGNYNSIGIELCVNDMDNFHITRKNAAALVSYLMNEFDIPLSNVVPHNYWSGKNCPTNLLPVFENFKMQVMESLSYIYEPDPNLRVIKSPFSDNIKEYYDSDQIGTISYSKGYTVELGRISGELTGTILLGDPDKAEWDLEANKAIEGAVISGVINQALNKMLQEGFLPGFREVAEARAELDSIVGDNLKEIVELRVSEMDLKTLDEAPFFKMDYLTIEAMFEQSTNVHYKEKLVLDDVDWDRKQLQKDATVLVLVCLLAFFFSVGLSGAALFNLFRTVSQTVFRQVLT
nr:peptidoglycan-binding protein [Halobacillus litoralis]